MLALIDRFLDLPEDQQMLFRLPPPGPWANCGT